MARPIKETPILYGEDARRFVERMNEHRRVSPEERARINANYEMCMEWMRRGEERQKKLQEQREKEKEEQQQEQKDEGEQQ